MRNVALILAMLSMLLLAALPAVAQDNGNSCVGVQEVSNTGDAETSVELDLGAAAEDETEDLEDLIDLDLIEDVEEDLGDEEADQLFDVLLDVFEDNNGDGADDSDAGDVIIEDVGSEITVSPSNAVDCDQSVEQTATAVG